MKMDERKRLRIRNKTDLILGLVLAVLAIILLNVPNFTAYCLYMHESTLAGGDIYCAGMIVAKTIASVAAAAFGYLSLKKVIGALAYEP